MSVAILAKQNTLLFPKVWQDASLESRRHELMQNYNDQIILFTKLIFHLSSQRGLGWQWRRRTFEIHLWENGEVSERPLYLHTDANICTILFLVSSVPGASLNCHGGGRIFSAAVPKTGTATSISRWQFKSSIGYLRHPSLLWPLEVKCVFLAILPVNGIIHRISSMLLITVALWFSENALFCHCVFSLRNSPWDLWGERQIWNTRNR